MMIRTLCVSAIAVLAVSYPAMADTVQSPLVGVWRLTGWQAQEGDRTVKLYGDHPGGYYVFSKDGRFVFVMIGDHRAAPAGFPPTQEEKAKLYATLSAFNGTYTAADGNKFVVHVQDSWNQAWTDTDQSRDFTISGDTLKVNFTTRDPLTGNLLAVTTTSQRTE